MGKITEYICSKLNILFILAFLLFDSLLEIFTSSRKSVRLSDLADLHVHSTVLVCLGFKTKHRRTFLSAPRDFNMTCRVIRCYRCFILLLNTAVAKIIPNISSVTNGNL